MVSLDKFGFVMEGIVLMASSSIPGNPSSFLFLRIFHAIFNKDWISSTRLARVKFSLEL